MSETPKNKDKKMLLLGLIFCVGVGISLFISFISFNMVGQLQQKYQDDHKLLSGVANRSLNTFLFINNTQLQLDQDIINGLNSTELKHKYLGR